MLVLGIVLGAAAAGSFLYFVPVVDQGRERSITAVQPNGGNLEAFHVNVPADRIFTGQPNGATTFPEGVDWPDNLRAEDAQVEIFKLRNADDRIVGVASRIAVSGNLTSFEWVMHLPARGSLYFVLGPLAEVGGQRPGRLRAGTREFADMNGGIVEQYVAEDEAGRLELKTLLVSTKLPDDLLADSVALLDESP